jgi:uncharacterized repeat protein (TIGR03803 family)
VNGVLYGTTELGGLDRCGRFRPHGCGTVFSLNLSTGAETVLYSFCGRGKQCRDGSNPGGSLLRVHRKLYGTTLDGGVINDQWPEGAGTIFWIKTP